jgi:hypothetical protein
MKRGIRINSVAIYAARRNPIRAALPADRIHPLPPPQPEQPPASEETVRPVTFPPALATAMLQPLLQSLSREREPLT